MFSQEKLQLGYARETKHSSAFVRENSFTNINWQYLEKAHCGDKYKT